MSESKFKIGDRAMFAEGDYCTVIVHLKSEEKFIYKSDTWRSGASELLGDTDYCTSDGYFWSSENTFTNHYRKVRDTELARKMYKDIHKEEGGFIWVK